MDKKNKIPTVSMAGEVKDNDPRFNKIVADSFDFKSGSQDLLAQVFSELKKSQDIKAIKLSFTEDPLKLSEFSSIYRKKTSLLSNELLKRIRDTEELIGGIILPLKANQVSLFGRPRANRFDIGFTINIKPEIYEKYKDEEIEKIKRDTIPKLRELLLNCGKTTGLKDKDKITFSQFLKQIVEDVYVFGWWAVEARYDHFGNFHSFRAVDAGTIYYASPNKEDTEEAEAIRQKAREVLSRLEGHKIPIKQFSEGEYTWVQVIDNQPYQVFTDDQLLVWSFTPSADILRGGYPITIIERVIGSITTHINLTTYNKMYFINGRAAKSMLVFKSDNLEDADITTIRQQMTNHINTSNAAWRMPVFGVTTKDDIQIIPLDGGSRDMEFQYLADLNKRMIMAAFQVNPDEVAAMAYLSRGTVSQALAESNNEWKLLKSQESGLRPLLNSIEDFLNERLLPKINPEWANIFQIRLEGLDADSPEKEATLLSQAASLYFTFNDILDKVEKPRVPIGGDFPMNAAYLQILEKYFTMGEILEAFEPERYKGASKRPELQFYIGNPAWFQLQQLNFQKQQFEFSVQQQQMAIQQQQAMQEQAAEQQNAQRQDQVNGQQIIQEQSQTGENQQPKEEQESLDSVVNQLATLIEKSELNKTEKALPFSRKELLKRHKAAKKKIMDDFEKQSKKMVDELIAILEGKKSTTGHNH